MKRRVKLPVQLEGAIRSPAGVQDEVAYACFKSIIAKINGGLYTDINPENKRLIEGATLGGQFVDNLLKMTGALREQQSDLEDSDAIPEAAAAASGGTTIPDGTAQYQVLSWDGTAWVADWLRFHA